MVELLGDVLPERISGSSGRDAPAASVVGVGPKQIADGSLVGDFLDAVELADLVERVDGRRETSVQTEDLALDHGSQRQVIEQFRERLPHIRISVLAQALVVETIPREIMSKKGIAYTCVICLDSWLPLRMVSLSLNLTFKQTKSVTVSTE